MTIRKGSKVRVSADCRQPNAPKGTCAVRCDPWTVAGIRVVLLEGSAAAWPVKYLESAEEKR